MENISPDWVIQIEAVGGPCWVDGSEGDPGRTCNILKAEHYSTENEARENMTAIRRQYPNRRYTIEPIAPEVQP